ncbi:MAG: ABC transporter substrate-binding protein [Methyloligella sp. ZOD6]
MLMKASSPRAARRSAAHPLFGLLLLIVSAAAALAASTPALAEIVLTDAAGREVRLDKPAERIVTNESLILLSLALIDPDPIAKIAGWASPHRIDRGMYEAFEERFPAIDNIPEIGGYFPTGGMVEGVLSVGADLVIIQYWQQAWEPIATQLAAVGIPTIFLDGPETDALSPAEETRFSIKLVGNAIGRPKQAEEFSDFVALHYDRVTRALTDVKNRPTVLVDAHAGTECCSTPGADNRLTEFLHLAKAKSIGADVPGYDGRLNPEAVLAANPEIYIGTGGSHLSALGGLLLGGGVTPEKALSSLQAVLANSVRGKLQAVREGQVYGISHQLSISALNILMFECFAKWSHPEALEAVDPKETLTAINTRFLAAPLEGTFWIALEDDNFGPAP